MAARIAPGLANFLEGQMFIKEIVKLDTQGKFIPAVQLSDYDNPKDNLGLVKSYIFANSAPDTHGNQTRAVGSIDLLREIRLSYINGSSNRFVVIANYGHGKSHLALVLTNYFGKPYHSPEVEEILKRIDAPLQNNQPEAENFHEFKRQNDRFLVVRLRGDIQRTLREQFFPALKAAFREHPATENISLPFWQQQATQWLQTKIDDKQAKQFLREWGTDIPNLLQEVDQNNHEAYEQYVQLFAHLNNGVMPNAESNYSLREAVIWTIDHFCGEGKPLAGVLVLFDEFSQFVERYSQSKAIGDLQDLLNGIGDRKGKSLFLAFSPIDPDEVAERVQSGQVLQNIKKELSRIDRKYALYSLMESVLSASINTSDAAWGKFLQENPQVKGFIYGQATELVWSIYLKRYDKELNWTNDRFRDVVTKGCFPLHPLTTALLCHLKMQQGLDDDPRTILKFVREQIELKLNESAIKDGKANWILPIQLPDYFGKRISTPPLYSAYENAVDNLEKVLGGSVTQLHYNVLKALLVQEADGFNITGGKQIELLSHMAGLDFETTKENLITLTKNNITKFDDNTNYNSFWPVTINPQALEQKIRLNIGDKKFGDDELFALNSNLSSIISGSDRIEVSITWGTSSDWGASTVIITKDKLTPEYLLNLMKQYRVTFQGLQEGNHGLVCWLLSFDETDIDFFKTNALQTIHDAFPAETPPPVLLILPSSPAKSVADQFLRYQSLVTIGIDPDAIKEVGQIAYDNELERTKKALRKALGQVFGDEEKFASIPRKPQTMVVPQPYRANLNALMTVSVQDVMQKLYELAYPYRPPEFFTDLPANPKKGPSPLREAVKTVAKNLLHNRIGSALNGMTKVAQERICKNQLMVKWHLLSTTYWIQEPEVLSLKHAWDYLEEQVKPDEQETMVSSFIPILLNSPFGFDYNTATLLLAAWIGKHSKELRFYANGKVVGVDYLEQLLDQKTLQEFLGKICVQERLSIARRDADKALIEGRNLVNAIQKSEQHSQADASNVINKLNEIVSSGICPENEKEVFNQSINDLASALEISKQYDQSAKKLLASIAGENEIRKLLELRTSLKRIAIPDLVTPTQPSTTEIQEKLDQQIRKAVEASCEQAKKLSRIEGADAVRNDLHEQKALLEKAELLNFGPLISDAESKLDERIKKLKAEAEELSRRNQINAMTSKADLAKLYEYQEILQGISVESPTLFTLKNQKLGDIQRAISELEVFARATIQTYQEVDQTNGQALFEKILRSISRYTGTEFETRLNQVIEYLKQLNTFFSELQKVENLPLRTPDDVLEVKSRLQLMTTQYYEKIGTAQMAIMDKVQNDVEYRVQGEYAKAEKKIDDLERDLKSASSSKVREYLSNIPAFVTPEMKARIEKLRVMLDEKESQEKIAQIEKESQDVIIRIENLFLSIKDPQKRQECLERLQKNIVALN
jgi:hypothetical protein